MTWLRFESARSESPDLLKRVIDALLIRPCHQDRLGLVWQWRGCSSCPKEVCARLGAGIFSPYLTMRPPPITGIWSGSYLSGTRKVNHVFTPGGVSVTNSSPTVIPAFTNDILHFHYNWCSSSSVGPFFSSSFTFYFFTLHTPIFFSLRHLKDKYHRLIGIAHLTLRMERLYCKLIKVWLNVWSLLLFRLCLILQMFNTSDII